MFTQELENMTGAVSCLGCAINALKLMEQGQSKFQIRKYGLESYLRLDCAALSALNVFPQNQEVHSSGSAGSLYGLLNQTKSSIGARLLKQWLK